MQGENKNKNSSQEVKQETSKDVFEKKFCLSYCIAKSYNFQDLFLYLNKKYTIQKLQNVIVLEKKNEDSVCYIFDYAVIVAWNMSDDSIQKLIDEITLFEIERHENITKEKISYTIHNESLTKISKDCIFLPHNDNDIKLALSHGMSQSIELAFFEERIKVTNESTRYISESLARTGKINLSSKEISKMTGQVLVIEDAFQFEYELVDEVLEFFWDYPKYEIEYKSLYNYLGMQSRIATAEKRIGTMKDRLDRTANDQRNKHSSRLEWVITIGVTIECMLAVAHYLLKII